MVDLIAISIDKERLAVDQLTFLYKATLWIELSAALGLLSVIGICISLNSNYSRPSHAYTLNQLCEILQ